MEIVVLDGTEYMKASVAAKQFKYTSDYIGQLCRAKKIDAKLVGRTWFVNPKSLLDHKSNKYASLRSKEEKEEEDKSNDVPIKIKAVTPVLKSKTAKSLEAHSNTEAGTRSLRVNYEADEESLIPNINKHGDGGESKKKTIRVKAFSAKKLRVTGGVVKNTTNFEADELPEVALSGKLSVTPIPEANEEITEEEKNLQENDINKVLSGKREQVEETSDKDQKKVKVQKVKLSQKSKVRFNKKPKKTKQEIKFAPSSVADTSPQSVEISRVVLVSPLIASVLAVLCVGLLFSASSNATVTSESYQGGVTLQVANLLEVFTQ